MVKGTNHYLVERLKDKMTNKPLNVSIYARNCEYYSTGSDIMLTLTLYETCSKHGLSSSLIKDQKTNVPKRMEISVFGKLEFGRSHIKMQRVVVAIRLAPQIR